MNSTFSINREPSAAGGRSITCHDCGRTSHHPDDVKNLYCGNCHVFHSKGAEMPRNGAENWEIELQSRISLDADAIVLLRGKVTRRGIQKLIAKLELMQDEYPDVPAEPCSGNDWHLGIIDDSIVDDSVEAATPEIIEAASD